MMNIMFLFSERGITDGYRHMDGFSSHAFRWINDKGEAFFVKYHIKSDIGVKTLSLDKIKELEAAGAKDYHTADLYNHIAEGKTATWTFNIQAMPEKEAETYRYDVTDITKIWPHGDYPLIPLAKLVLNRNPTNFFADMEQAAFSPGTLVPGIQLSNDRILLARVFSYPDTQRHRLGPNFDQIPVNCPLSGVFNYQRDGFMAVNGNGGTMVNYEPNSVQSTPKEDKQFADKPFKVGGLAQRNTFTVTDVDFEQPRAFWVKVLKEENKEYLVNTMYNGMKTCRVDIKERMIGLCTRVHPEFGQRLAKKLGMNPESPKL